VQVRGAESHVAAQWMARRIVSSVPVLYRTGRGESLWPQVVATVGSLDFKFDVNRMVIRDQGTDVFVNGNPLETPERETLTPLPKGETLTVEIELQDGDGDATAWGRVLG
jgi:N-acetylglutamate synthase/N-acetylornithine aminotransferase